MGEKLLKIFACIFIMLSVLRGTYVIQDGIEGLENDIDDVFNEIYASYNELEKQIKELEERNASYEDELLRQKIEFIESMEFGIGTIVHRLENNGVYCYTVKVDNDTAVISSRDLFSVDETVLVCKVENTLFLIDIS